MCGFEPHRRYWHHAKRVSGLEGNRPTIGGSLLNMGSRWTLVLCRGLSKPSSQESRDGRYYGSVKDTPHSKCGARVSVWVRVPPGALAPLESGGALTRPVWWNGRHARLKSGCPVGRVGSSPTTGTGEAKQVNGGKLFGACFCRHWGV